MLISTALHASVRSWHLAGAKRHPTLHSHSDTTYHLLNITMSDERLSPFTYCIVVQFVLLFVTCNLISPTLRQ